MRKIKTVTWSNGTAIFSKRPPFVFVFNRCDGRSTERNSELYVVFYCSSDTIVVTEPLVVGKGSRYMRLPPSVAANQTFH